MGNILTSLVMELPTGACRNVELVKDRLVLEDCSGGAEGDEEDVDLAQGGILQGVDLLGEVGAEGAVEGEGEPVVAVGEGCAFGEGEFNGGGAVGGGERFVEAGGKGAEGHRRLSGHCSNGAGDLTRFGSRVFGGAAGKWLCLQCVGDWAFTCNG